MREYVTTFDLDKIDDYVEVTVLYQKTKFGMEVTDVILNDDFECDGEEYERGTSLFSCNLDDYASRGVEDFSDELSEKLTDEYEGRCHESSMYFYELNQECSYGKGRID